jgi:hypothetical protein
MTPHDDDQAVLEDVQQMLTVPATLLPDRTLNNSGGDFCRGMVLLIPCRKIHIAAVVWPDGRLGGYQVVLCEESTIFVKDAVIFCTELAHPLYHKAMLHWFRAQGLAGSVAEETP